MPTIQINVPPRAVDALAARYGYQTTVLNAQNQPIPNPETKLEFARQRLIDYARNTAIGYEADRDAEAARQTAIANAQAIQIT